MGCCGSKGPTVQMPQVPTGKITVPKLQADGSIKFPGPAPMVDGYIVSNEDETVLIPNSQHCSYLITSVMLQKDGAYRPYHVCRHNKCPHRGKEVTPSICSKCPFMESKKGG